jgi:hypothetical protein
MANTLKFGNGEWYGKKDTILAYNDENSNYKPLPFNFSRASKATVINKDGLIEVVGSGQPRVDYKDNTKGALLLEPSRSNSLLQSNQFDTTWGLSSSIALTSGQSGVGGSTDAWLLKKTDASSRYINQSLTLSSSTYSYSVFAKKESGNWLYVRLADSGGSLASTSYFDLENGVVGSTSADSLSIHSYNNGWYRCEVKFTHSIGNVRMYPAVGDGSPSGGSGGEGIYIQNAQLEAGSYATSYIPTSGSAVTRSADVCANAGNEQVFNDSEGVLMVEINALSDLDDTRYVTLNEGTSAVNRLSIQYRNSGELRLYNGGTSTAQMIYRDSSANLTENLKIAIKYGTTSSSYKVYINGISKTIASAFVATAMSGLDNIKFIDANGVGSPFRGKIKQLKYYNTALTDQELQALTQV